jgi:cell division protein FtsI (penicillin-binding protein 3)
MEATGKNSGGWTEFKKDTLGRLVARNVYTDDDSLANVVNMGLKDAVYLLENNGYKVAFNGYGKVVEQIPAAGTKLAKNSTVTLKLQENGD